ncbi:PACE efflux transporter [Pseudohoeflea suaedae]|uniref:PACE efflux transporter n=1 Tax=Pseudohoeflea suaedae TaxID=877384 RepID=A0A4R5PNR3_9HYPH|nr:PACE efflux transporter [Pseudohoeflea suaedae]TDH38700.1 PACE efflux transporter [Pseudohoeflea suaedae]
MRSTKDRIRQALSFEIIGLIIVTPLFAWLFAHPMDQTGILVLMGATGATLWNYIFNLGFDHLLRAWRGTTSKTLPLRILHAVGFELTLLVLLLPIFAWWMGISLFEAFLIDIAFAAFYMVYAFVFTWGYDLVFPPEAATSR